jgi:predicted O-methyltransferase YrrM
MQITEFVTVVQRRKLTIDSKLFPVMSPLFAIETHMSMEERVALGAMAMTLPVQFVACEIGSYLGASACFLAAAASFKEGTIHCVDTWDNRAMGSEPWRDTYAEFLRNVEGFQQYIVPHRGEALAVASEVPSELDMLLVDADHSYEMVKKDLGVYVPKIKAGGLLLLHDAQEQSVQRALDEYLSRHHLLHLGTTHSLCMLRIPQESQKQS